MNAKFVFKLKVSMVIMFVQDLENCLSLVKHNRNAQKTGEEATYYFLFEFITNLIILHACTWLKEVLTQRKQ